MVRIVAVAAVCILAASCGGASDAPSGRPTTTDFDDMLTVDEEERRAFDARIRREFRAAKSRREGQLVANRRVLDRLTPFPGARLVRETHGGTADIDQPDLTDDELEYQVYVEQTVRPYERFELLTSDTWSTYRTYRLPSGASTTAAWRHYAQLFRGWGHLARERGTSGQGHRMFADDYWNAGTCIWVHIGFADQPPIPPARTLVVATTAQAERNCVGG